MERGWSQGVGSFRWVIPISSDSVCVTSGLMNVDVHAVTRRAQSAWNEDAHTPLNKIIQTCVQCHFTNTSWFTTESSVKMFLWHTSLSRFTVEGFAGIYQISWSPIFGVIYSNTIPFFYKKKKKNRYSFQIMQCLILLAAKRRTVVMTMDQSWTVINVFNS